MAVKKYLSNLQSLLSRYDYAFPKSLVAQKPASPRDHARLMVYNRANGAVSYRRFSDLQKYLPKGAVLVFNETKVIPARLALTKKTGGAAHILIAERRGGLLSALSDRKLKRGSVLHLTKDIWFTVRGSRGKYFLLEPSFMPVQLDAILERYGKVPIPPYIKHSPLSERELRKEYQSVFARYAGSIAAPTASLHFTPGLVQKLRRAGFGIAFITLHVNLGTFAPLSEENLKRRKLNKEWFAIDEATETFLNDAKKRGAPIVAVGTTVLRTLESAATSKGILKSRSGTTELFIREGYRFKFVDGLITNFHVPKSSLMMLTSALIGREKTLALYRAAIKKKFRLFSFGDGMLIC